MIDSLEVNDFLHCATPQGWLDAVPAHLPELLIDHANCEKKAASTAMGLLFRYVEPTNFTTGLSRLAREELRHFEQVTAHMRRLGIANRQLSASRYAAGLRSLVRSGEPERLLDTLIVSAVVEARSCERFQCLVSILTGPLRDFYARLQDSERRHFHRYLNFAENLAEAGLQPKLNQVLARDAELISISDREFRFHSGPLLADIIA